MYTIIIFLIIVLVKAKAFKACQESINLRLLRILLAFRNPD